MGLVFQVNSSYQGSLLCGGGSGAGAFWYSNQAIPPQEDRTCYSMILRPLQIPDLKDLKHKINLKIPIFENEDTDISFLQAKSKEERKKILRSRFPHDPNATQVRVITFW